jgi:hypothetical protein
MPSDTIIKEIKIVSLKEFSGSIEDLLHGGINKNFWYRGVQDFEYNLLPTLYRHKTISDLSKLNELEQIMMTRFKERSIPFLDRSIDYDDVWGWMFIMQHFGIPTRLLDWTENPFIGLFFALQESEKTMEKDAAVWILDPDNWNNTALKHMNFKSGILNKDAMIIHNYETKKLDTSILTSPPLSIYGDHNSPRIVSQRGVFIIYGSNNKPMEEIYKDIYDSDDILFKFIIPKDKKADIILSLNKIGITESVIFPDLEGVACEIKNKIFGGK